MLFKPKLYTDKRGEKIRTKKHRVLHTKSHIKNNKKKEEGKTQGRSPFFFYKISSS
jgi:hypothetical protein